MARGKWKSGKVTLSVLFHSIYSRKNRFPDVIGVGIVGSYARGQEGKYSDVDLDIYVSKMPENPYDRYTLRYWDEKLVSLKYTLLDDERSALTNPRPRSGLCLVCAR